MLFIAIYDFQMLPFFLILPCNSLGLWRVNHQVIYLVAKDEQHWLLANKHRHPLKMVKNQQLNQ